MGFWDKVKSLVGGDGDGSGGPKRGAGLEALRYAIGLVSRDVAGFNLKQPAVA